MGNWLDLHMHSHFSTDGFHTPEELAVLCSCAGIRVMALSDHNSAAGCVRMQKAAKSRGITCIPAIELDCQMDGQLFHMLGYGIDYRDPVWQTHERETHTLERSASSQILASAHAMGLAFDDEAVLAMAGVGPIEYLMIAEVALADPRNDDHALLALYRPGGARSENALLNFYWDCCSPGKPAYVYVPYIDYRDAVRMIASSGGVPVLAHPGQNFGCDAQALAAILAAGVQGVETDCSYHTPDTAAFYCAQAAQRGVLRTIGSDFHGRTKPTVKLGTLPLPGQDEIYRQLQDAIALASGARA